MADDATIVKTPNGDEFVVEIWKPSWGEGIGLWDSVGLALWALVSPWWRINVKEFPVRGPKAMHRERAPSRAQAQQRAKTIAQSLSHTGSLPPTDTR